MSVKPLSTVRLCRKKKGLAAGKTKHGKGAKIMAITDVSGFPVAAHIESASPHEVKLVEATIDSGFTDMPLPRLLAIRHMTAMGLLRLFLMGAALKGLRPIGKAGKK